MVTPYPKGQRRSGVGVTNNSRAWGSLRSLRATPPGFADQDPSRRRVFATAIEQCEQLLRGAEQLGYASRPLNLFYGLSQAGRAITAAWSPPGFSEPGSVDLAWQLDGHGIKVVESTLDDALDQIKLADQLRKPLPTQSRKRLGAFPAVARVLGSDSLLQPASLIDLWAALPEAIGRPAPGDDARWGPIRITWDEQPSGENIITRAVQTWTHNWPNDQLAAWTRDESSLNANVALAIIARYPTLKPPAVIEMPWRHNWFGQYRGSLLLTWPMSSNGDAADRQWFLDLMTDRYRDQRWAFPSIAGQKLHPLVIWWAVLYTMSMLARYQPAAWARAIDVDGSAWAVPLEHLLDEALGALPDVIFQALEQAPLVDHEFPLPGDGILDYG
jgi:hypothetical protein